jgi:hypothetical protein
MLTRTHPAPIPDRTRDELYELLLPQVGNLAVLPKY